MINVDKDILQGKTVVQLNLMQDQKLVQPITNMSNVVVENMSSQEIHFGKKQQNVKTLKTIKARKSQTFEEG